MKAAILAPQHQALAAAVDEAHAGRLAAQKLIHELRAGSTDPDLLYWSHLKAQASTDRLRGFLRELQREIERGGAHE